MSEDEIYRVFSDLPQELISWYIQYVKAHNISEHEETDVPQEEKPKEVKGIVFGKTPEIIERRKKVYELVGSKTEGEIASELGISVATVENDLTFLRRKGIIENKGTKKEQKEKRRAEIAKLYGKYSTTQLAEKFKVSEGTIIDDIEYLMRTGKLQEQDHEEVRRRRQAIPELRKKFHVTEIAKMFGVSTWTINNDIRWLKERGLIDETEEIRGRRSREKVASIEERRRKVAKWYGKKTSKEMASLLGVRVEIVRKRY